jgi:hypothetical protein
MRAVQFGELEAGAVGTLRSGYEGVHHRVDPGKVQRLWHMPAVVERHGGRGDGGPGAFACLHGPTTLAPGRQGRSLAARVRQLNADGRVGIGGDIGDQTGEGRFLRVVPQSGVAGRDAALGQDAGGLHDHHARAGNGQGAEVLPVPRLDHALHRRILAHGGGDDPVLQRKAAEGDRREKKAHASISPCSLNRVFNSPAWNISLMMSQPPTNSPLT